MSILRKIYPVQLILKMVIITMLHFSLAEFSCNFGARWTGRGLYECDISSDTWGAVSGFGNNGRAPSDGLRDGFFITTLLNSQNQAIFELPNLSLTDHSGSLSFYYKFFNPGTSTLIISVCGRLHTITPQSRDSWESTSGIRIYCNGKRPTVQFFAVWGHTTGRIGVDNINIVSTPPPTTSTTTTTTTATTTVKSTTTTTNSPTYTTKHTTTPMTTTIMTSMTTSELSTFPSQSTVSDSTLSVTTENLTTVPPVLIPSQLETRRRTTTVVAATLSVFFIVLVVITLVVVIKRIKRSKIKREGPVVALSRSSNYNRENHYETDLSNAYETFSEGLNPVQESVQASNGDSGREEMIVNILYQSVDRV